MGEPFSELKGVGKSPSFAKAKEDKAAITQNIKEDLSMSQSEPTPPKRQDYNRSA
jgi:hypothetical protein